MKIERIRNVHLRKDDDGDVVIINHNNVDESILFINRQQIMSIEVTDSYSKPDLNFLSECPNIENLTINNHFINDLSGIYHLRNIKVLAINDTNPSLELDLNHLSTLEVIYGQLPKKVHGLGSLKNLKRLELWGYNPKGKNLEDFINLKELIFLELTKSNITSLHGIRGLTKLNHLGLYYLRALNNIEEIKYLSDGLETLKVENCKKIDNFGVISHLKKLKLLKMTDCGSISSIRFVKEIPGLKSLVFARTDVLDGDLSACKGIEYVYFTEKKHYSNRLKDFTSQNYK